MRPHPSSEGDRSILVVVFRAWIRVEGTHWCKKSDGSISGYVVVCLWEICGIDEQR